MIDALRAIWTATLTMQLLKRGIRRGWMAGTKPLQPGEPRLAGPAFTLRFVPGREDVSTRESYAAPNSLRDAIEAMPEGVVAVIDSRGEQGAGTLGDILAGRMKKRGVAGIVSDGPMRDVAGVRAIDIPVWCNGAAAPPSIAALWFAGWQEPIGCGGAAVFPDDLVVADDDGAVVLPQALAAEIAEDGAEQEALEAWILAEIERGEPVKGLYPPDDAALARYRAAKSEQD
ncbi:MAG: ribonuclease activity regulator RraA [Rhodospirillaceae bacterium]|nr:ribonuclease activity regulator RraA [Rhodospirillaceae bacterium]